MGSDRLTGALLQTLAASKRGGTMLELGTGTGLATAWLLAGMDASATLTTVDHDAAMQAIARHHLATDGRLTWVLRDGGAFISEALTRDATFDLIFADTWPGKYTHLEETLCLLRPGGLYVIDDMLPQPSWPTGHAPNVAALIATLEAHPDLVITKLAWSTGLILATKR